MVADLGLQDSRYYSPVWATLRRLIWALPAVLAVPAFTMAADLPVRPSELNGQPRLDVGQLVLLLMPDKAATYVGWDHRLDSKIVWKTDGYEAGTLTDGSTYNTRKGIVRVSVEGKIATVLGRGREELGWTVTYISTTAPKFGPEEILMEPGENAGSCFGSMYDGCSFDAPLKSLAAVGIAATKLCGRVGGESKFAFLLQHPERRPTIMVWEQNAGSGGANSSIKLKLNAKASKHLCDADARTFSNPSTDAAQPTPRPKSQLNGVSREVDAKLVYCLLPKAQYGQYSSYDGGKSARTLLMTGCPDQLMAWLEICEVSGDTKDSCVLKAAIIAQAAIRSFNK